MNQQIVKEFLEKQRYKRIDYIEGVTYKRMKDINKTKSDKLKDVLRMMH